MKMRSINFINNRKLTWRLAPLYRNALLLTGLLLSGKSQFRPPTGRVRLLTAGALIPGKPAAAYCFHQRHPDRLTAAIDAPVIASGATTPNNRVAVTRAFYASGARWRKNANCNGLYRRTERRSRCRANAGSDFNSATGGDSALALYDQLSTIAQH